MTSADDQDGGDEPPFDPYRFGKPDVPPPPEYAPPGYVSDDPPAEPERPAQPSGGYPPPTGYAGFVLPPQGPYSPYNYPSPHQGYAPPGRSNGRAVAAMVLGIGSIVFCWTTVFNLVLLVPALIFSLLGLNTAKATGGNGRGMAIAGIVCTIVGFVLTVAIVILAFHLSSTCSGITQGSSQYRRCIENHL